jgi:hypothetical protein
MSITLELNAGGAYLVRALSPDAFDLARAVIAARARPTAWEERRAHRHASQAVFCFLFGGWRVLVISSWRPAC